MGDSAGGGLRLAACLVLVAVVVVSAAFGVVVGAFFW